MILGPRGTMVGGVWGLGLGGVWGGQGFMQGKIIANHMFWWTHPWVLTVKPVYKLSNCV